MSDKVKFNVSCEMYSRWVPHFLGMLEAMEYYGAIGSSRRVAIYSDGDGNFRPKFKWDIESETADPIENDNGDLLFDLG